MEEKRKELRRKAMRLPLLPGVYIMKNAQNEIIYIGKAKALKNRVSQYFGSQNGHPVKVRKMVENVDHFDYIVTDSEFEALVLECSLIKQHTPKYNILLKDDKGYSYIRIAGNAYKTIQAVLQRADDGAEYLGPFTSSFAAKQSVDAANKIFMLPQCKRDFDSLKPKERPCLHYYIHQCCGVCTGKVDQKEYAQTVDQAIRFLKGDSTDILKQLQQDMQIASEHLEFEQAAKLRDRIQAIERLQEKQKVIYKSVDEQDVFALAESDNLVCLAILRFAKGRLFDSEHFFFDKTDEISKMYPEVITSYYALRQDIPKRVTVDTEIENAQDLERWLSDKRGSKVVIFTPQRGEQVEVVKMCHENAQEQLAIRLGKSGKTVAVLEELRDLLGLEKTPTYIESYDISHTAGQDSVAGMVVFKDAKPLKSAYRRFAIQTFVGNDDYRSMQEVLTRRFIEYEKAKLHGIQDGFGKLPDLILLDGGLGQIHAVEPVLKEFGLSIPLFGMVKDNKHKTRAIAKNGGEIEIQSKRYVFTLISSIQDEVHRFSIQYHHQKHKNRTLAMTLTEIDGVGEKRAKALLQHFKSLKAIQNASVAEIMEVKTIHEKEALKIFEYFHH